MGLFKSVTKALKKVVSVAAPVIGAAVGGPAGFAQGNALGKAVAGKYSLIDGKGNENSLLSTASTLGNIYGGISGLSSGFSGGGGALGGGNYDFGGAGGTLGSSLGGGGSFMPAASSGGFGLGSIANSLGLGDYYNGSALQSILPSLSGGGNSISSLLGGGGSSGSFMPQQGGGGLSLRDLLLGGGTLGAGIYAADTAKDAAGQQVIGINQGLDSIGKGYDVARNTLQPYYQAGTKSLAEIMNLNGTNGAPAQQEAYARFNVSPDYQFRLQQGQNALQGNAAARGGLYSGQSLKDLVGYNQGQAGQEYGNYYNRIAQTANNGANVGGSLASLAQNYFGNQADLQRSRGDALASGKVGQANQYQQTLGNLVNYATAPKYNDNLYRQG